MFQINQVVTAPFAAGGRTKHYQVIVHSLTDSHAMVFALDGCIYGPARISTLRLYVGNAREDLIAARHLFMQDAAPNRDDNGNEPIAEEALHNADVVNANVDDAVDVAHVIVDEFAGQPRHNNGENNMQDDGADIAENVWERLQDEALGTMLLQKDLSHKECQLCGDMCGSGYTCECDRYMCNTCVHDYMATVLQSVAVTEKPICPFKCGSEFSWISLAKIVTESMFDASVRHFGKPEIVQQDVVTGTFEDSCANIKTQLKSSLAEAQVLRTPCCNAAFLDFDACFALWCSSCSNYFCAWCVSAESVSADSVVAHNHVRHCPENPHPGAVFGDYKKWKHHCECKKRKRVDDTTHKARLMLQSVLEILD